MSAPQVLIIRPAWERIASRLKAESIEIDPIISEEDGSITYQGEPRDLADLHPKVAWLSMMPSAGSPFVNSP